MNLNKVASEIAGRPISVLSGHPHLPPHMADLVEGSSFTDGSRIYVPEGVDVKTALEMVEAAAASLRDMVGMDATQETVLSGKDVCDERAEALYQTMDVFARRSAVADTVKRASLDREFLERISKHAAQFEPQKARQWRKRARRITQLAPNGNAFHETIAQHALRLTYGASEGSSGGADYGMPFAGVPSLQDASSRKHPRQAASETPRLRMLDAEIEASVKKLNALRPDEKLPLYKRLNLSAQHEENLVYTAGLAPDWGSYSYESLKGEVDPIIRKLQRRLEELVPNQHAQRTKSCDGSEIDIEGVIEMAVDRRLGVYPRDDVFIDDYVIARDVQVGVLVDLSGSMAGGNIDSARLASIVLAESLDSLGDTWSLVGFTGSYPIVKLQIYKDVHEEFVPQVRNRLAGMEASNENRDGAAIRWMTDYLSAAPHKTNILLVVSDGQPLDQMYQNGIEDTRKAILETEAKGIIPYAVTLDRQGPEYLDGLYGRGRYVVCQDVRELPQLLGDFFTRIAC